MSFEYDVESAVREAIGRGGRQDYSYRKMSRRNAAVGVPGPRLVEQGADLAVVIELSADAAPVAVEEVRDAVGRVLRQHPVRRLAVIGPATWADWANQSWETRPHGILEAEHVEAKPGEGLAAVNELETEPSAIVVITDRNLAWPSAVDNDSAVAIVVPILVDGEMLDRVDDSASADVEMSRMLGR